MIFATFSIILVICLYSVPAQAAPAEATSESDDYVVQELEHQLQPEPNQQELITEIVSQMIDITVMPHSPGYFVHTAFAITEPDAQKQIIAYLEQMNPSSPEIFFGTSMFEISVSRNGIVEEFGLMSRRDAAGNNYLTKDGQFYTANPNLWRAIVAYYPRFDFENIHPGYMVSVWRGVQGISFHYYEAGVLAWFQTDEDVLRGQETSERISAFLDTMESYAGVPPGAVSTASGLWNIQEDETRVDLWDMQENENKRYNVY